MAKARLKIPVKGLRVDTVYDVEKLGVTVVAGEMRTSVHLKKYTDKERKDFKTIVVPHDWVEIIQDSQNVAS